MTTNRDIQIEDSDWLKIIRNLRKLERSTVDVGVIGSKAAQDRDGITMIQLATIHEFGAENIPQRSFIRQGFDANIDKIELFAKKCINSAFSNGNIRVDLNCLGLIMRAGVLEQFAISGDPAWVANSASTISIKGSDKPLIDEGLLRASITYRVT